MRKGGALTLENEERSKENQDGSEESSVSGQAASDSEKPSRPIRMKWGRPVEEPPEEPIEESPPEKEPEKSEEPPPLPKPDPRIEALRLKLERLAETEKEAQKAAEIRSGEAATGTTKEDSDALEKPNPSPPPRRKPTPEELRVMREREEARRRAAEREAKIREAENKRMRYELEQEELRKRLQRKRRSETVRNVLVAVLEAIISLFKSIHLSKKQVIAIIVTVVVTVTSAVILGNLLKSRIPSGGESEESSDEAETEEETVPYFRDMEIPSLGAGIVSLEGATPQKLRSEAGRFASSGVTSVSLILRDEDGKLLFSAKTDDALGIDSESEEFLSIEMVLEPFLSRDLYVSCVLPMRYDIDGDEYSRSVLYAYESALLLEVAEAGADEVILLGADAFIPTDAEMEQEDGTSAEEVIGEICATARMLHERSPETAVGIAFTPEFLVSRESDRYLAEIVGAFDLALLDLRSAVSQRDVYVAVSDGVSNHLYFILRYSMRVLIPAGSAEAVTSLEVHNWQEGTLPIVISEESEDG